MSRTERFANLLDFVVPFAGVLVAIVLLWDRAVDVTDLTLLAVTYLLTAVGITVGFHGLLTHRAFQTMPGLSASSTCSARCRCWTGSPTIAHIMRTPTAKAIRTARTSATAVAWPGSGMHTPGGCWRPTGRPTGNAMLRALRGSGDAVDRTRLSLLAAVSLLVPTLAGFALHGFTGSGTLRGLVWCGSSSCTM